jgi:hypothetical protein
MPTLIDLTIYRAARRPDPTAELALTAAEADVLSRVVRWADASALDFAAFAGLAIKVERMRRVMAGRIWTDTDTAELLDLLRRPPGKYWP